MQIAVTDHYRQVHEFMEKAGQEVPAKPFIPDQKTRILRARLILEEALETIHALGVNALIANDVFTAPGSRKLVEMSQIEFTCPREMDLVEVVDGCCDIKVVTTGTLIAIGVQDAEVQREVDESNLRKFGPGGYRNEHGKWIKPPDWVKPNLASIINRQIDAVKNDAGEEEREPCLATADSGSANSSSTELDMASD